MLRRAAIIPRFRAARKALPALAEREVWTRADLDRWQLERIQDVWTHAIEHVPYWRELHERLALPRRFDDLEHFHESVPILDKATVRSDGARLVSERAGRGSWHRTSGSSGAPTAVFRSHDAHRIALHSQYRFQQSWGVDFDGRWAFMWGNADGLAGGFRGLKSRALTPVVDRLRGRLRASPYELGSAELGRVLERIIDFKTEAIYTHSMAGHMLALEADRLGATIPSLRLVVLTAEPVRWATVAVVERAFGVPAVTEYGCNEAGLVASEAPDRTLRVRDDHVRVDTRERTDGKYDIVLSVLDNPSFPLLRYAVGDVTSAPIGRPDVGFSILQDVVGRDFDLLMAVDGSAIHAQAVEDIVDKYDDVRRWQLRQARDGSVRLDIEADASATVDSAERIRLRVSSLLKGYPVDVVTLDEFPPISSGKHRVVSSALAGTVLGERPDEQ